MPTYILFKNVKTQQNQKTRNIKNGLKIIFGLEITKIKDLRFLQNLRLNWKN